MSQPIVSIVTPCYNGERFLDRYFKSIMAQTYQSLEVILINDGSEDGSKDLAESYGEKLKSKGIRFIQVNQENQGQAAALNIGLKKITGDYFVWPDVDDELTIDSIEKRVLFLENHPEYDYCVSKAIGINETDQKELGVYAHKQTSDTKEIFEGLIWGPDAHYVCGTYMMRTCFLDRCIPGREIFPGRGGQNAQLLLPAAWNGRLGFVDEVLYKYYIREDSHSHSALQKDKNTIRQLEQFEEILIETIRKIGMRNHADYEDGVRKHYARLRFGHALNTKDKELIKKYADQLKALDIFTRKDQYLIFRYTSKILKRIRPVD